MSSTYCMPKCLIFSHRIIHIILIYNLSRGFKSIFTHSLASCLFVCLFAWGLTALQHKQAIISRHNSRIIYHVGQETKEIYNKTMKQYNKPRKSCVLFSLGFLETIPSPRLGFHRGVFLANHLASTDNSNRTTKRQNT